MHSDEVSLPPALEIKILEVQLANQVQEYKELQDRYFDLQLLLDVALKDLGSKVRKEKELIHDIYRWDVEDQLSLN